MIRAGVLLLALLVPAPAQAATYWVEYPFTRNIVPVYNATGRDNALTAAMRWEVSTPVDTYRVSSDPASGISIRWYEPLRGTKYGGKALPSWHWDGSGWRIKDCTVGISPYVAGAGRPYGRWLEAIVSHETGHCLGWFRHLDPSSSSIMRSYLSKSGTLAGYRYRPTAWDLSTLGAAYR